MRSNNSVERDHPQAALLGPLRGSGVLSRQTLELNMEIQVSRQAVCAADDQCGPLKMLIHVEPNSSIEEFVTVLENTKFLQFSSSHTSILGVCENVPVVRVFSRFFSQKQNEYFVPQDLSVSEVIENGALYFKF